MTVIPGKYVDAEGGGATVIAAARHGLDGGKMVVYRAGDGELRVLSETEWKESGFTCAAELELRDYLDGGESRAELIRRIFDLFATRGGVYSLYWRSAVGGEGYNYACENHSLVAGCYRGIDSCKNCGRGSLSIFSPEAVDKHLRGDQTVGIYPVSAGGLCRFLVMEPGSESAARALRQACGELELPCYMERRSGGFRLWLFFAEPQPLVLLRRLGCGIITRAMDVSPDVDFDMYDKFLPCREEICPGDMGFHLRLPFGGADKSVFVDENCEPLPYGAAELFRVRVITRGYLADRLKALGDPGPGRLWPEPGAGDLPELPAGLDIAFDGAFAVRKAGLSHRTLLSLRRMSCAKAADRPYGQFDSLGPCVIRGFDEDGDFLRLPRGLRTQLEYLCRASRIDPDIQDAAPKRERVFFTLFRPVGVEQRRAAEQLAEKPEGVLSAPQGWGKTGAVARLIELKCAKTLILVADEETRLRWSANVLEYLGVDSERSGAKVHVRLVTDRRIRDKYNMVILTDCSRLPLDEEVFARIKGLTPRWFYGITASDTRRDGLWSLIKMLCGDVFKARP